MTWKNKRVAITGATGFVGSALAKTLLNEGAKVHALRRPTSNIEPFFSLPISWVEGDVTKPAALKGFFNGCDYVIHTAGMLGEAGVDEKVYQQLHVEGTGHVLEEIAVLAPSPKVLYVSSPGVLGPISGPPAAEDAPYAPSNPYERSKAAAEKLVRDYAASGLEIVIARPEFIYGPGDRHVLGLFQAIQSGRFFYIGDGRNTCHPTYISDAVEGLLLSLNHGQSGAIYHITGPRPVTFRELATTIARVLDVAPPRFQLPRSLAWAGASMVEFVGGIVGKPPPLSRTGVAFFSEDRRFSWAKAAKDLDYQPKVDLNEGVSRTIDWYRHEGLLK